MLYLNHIKLKYTSFLVIVLLLGSLVSAQKFTNKRKVLEQQRKALQKQITRNKKELERVKTEEKNSIKQLEVIGEQIQTREKVIENVSQETFEISIEISNQHKFVEAKARHTGPKIGLCKLPCICIQEARCSFRPIICF